MERPTQEIGGYGNGGNPSHITARERKRRGPHWPMRHHPILDVKAMAINASGEKGGHAALFSHHCWRDLRAALPNVHPRTAASMVSAQRALCASRPFYVTLTVCGRSGLALTGVGAIAIETSLSDASPLRGNLAKCRCRPFALAIEVEWRKRAISVVPAQPKARPEGQHQAFDASAARGGLRVAVVSKRCDIFKEHKDTQSESFRERKIGEQCS